MERSHVSASDLWFVVPKTIGILDRKSGDFVRAAPVLSVRSYPPGVVRPSSPIRRDCTAVEIVTSYGSRWYGFADAQIGSDLEMHVKLLPGQERDEVLMRWPPSSGL